MNARAEPGLSHDQLMKDIAAARTVEVWPIMPGPGEVLVGKSKKLSPTQAKELIAILSDPASYSPGPHRCPFSPRYGVGLSGNFGKLELEFCFHCLDYRAALSGEKSYESQSFEPSAKKLQSFFQGLALKEE